MTPTYRVSHLAAYARWKQNENEDLGWLYQSIFSSESTESQSRGTAFHAALEKAVEGDYDTVEAQGYTFAFTCSAEITLPKVREQRRGKDYGGIIVSGQCDGIEGRRIIDHKTVSGGFDAEHHLDGWQHRFYLDIFEADRFDWHVWEVGEMKRKVPDNLEDMDSEDRSAASTAAIFAPKAYEVYAHHLLTQYRYPAIEDDCRALALEFKEFTARMGWNNRAA